MFDTTKEDLRDILRNAHEGKLQLPDFQRSYVWTDSDVHSLIASIAKGFPVGALLTLQVGGEVNFKPRLLEGVPEQSTSPSELLLDGQQRTTSLYQAFYADTPVRVRSDKKATVQLSRYYYIDMKRAVETGEDIQDAIVGVPEDRIIRSHFGREVNLDLSSRDKEFAQDFFPLNQVFDPHGWLYQWRDYWRERDRDTADLQRDFHQRFIDRMSRYKFPVIKLDKENSREAVCLVFERVNVGGKKLDAFELLTAIYASDEFDLREDWSGDKKQALAGRYEKITEYQTPDGTAKRSVLKGLASTDFLQACTLLHTRDKRLERAKEGVTGKELPQISCRRDALLALPLTGYTSHADDVEAGFRKAADFLNEQNIFWSRDMPYPPLAVALACVFAILGDTAQSAAAKEKIATWFWSVTFGELYGSTTETRMARDVPEIVEWIRGGAKPRSVDEAIFQQERLHSLRSRQSAAFKGAYAQLMRHGCQDFITGRPFELMTYFNDDVDVHHIFPRAWCEKQGIPASVYNSIINKTPLSKKSNIRIGGRAPSVYLQNIEQRDGLTANQLDDILRSHRIDPAHLRADDFDAFYQTRMQALSEIIAGAMNKPVVLEQGADEPETDIDAGEEDDEETMMSETV